jgi:hypothetical protein
MESLGGFAGSAQKALINFYDAERTSNEWRTSPIIEPEKLTNSAHGDENLLAADSDLSEGLFSFRSAPTPGEQNLYIWHLPGGSPVEVGPAFSRAALESTPTGRVGEISRPSASSDLEHVLFAIQGPGNTNPGVNDLWPGDTTVANNGTSLGGVGFRSLYEYEGTENEGTDTRRPTLVGVNDNGELISQCGTSLGFPREGSFQVPGLSDGEVYNAIAGSAGVSRVFFTAAGATEGPARDACTEGGNGKGPHADELYVRINASQTVAISEPSLLVPGRQCSGICREDEEDVDKSSAGVFQGASEGGSRVFFLTSQPLVDGDEDNTTDLYEAHLGGEPGHEEVIELVQVSHDPNAGEAAEVQGVARVSADGSRVYYVAKGKLTTALSPTGDEAEPGEPNLYVYDTDTNQTAFIGTLSPSDEEDWQQEDYRPVDANECQPGEGECEAGRFLVFTSSADLTPGDTSDVPQVFEYDARERTLVRVSVGQDGFNDNGEAEGHAASIVHPVYRESEDPAPQLTSVSGDGSIVVFQSSDALTQHAAEGFPNVYEYRGGEVSLISDGEDRTVGLEDIPSTSLVGLDGSGQDVFFTTADPLVAEDGDTGVDVYDARIDGGFPPSLVPSECKAEACRGALAPVPLFPGVGSTSQSAGENLVETLPRPAVKAKVKGKPKKARSKARKAKPRKARAGRRRTTRRSSERGGARGAARGR